MATKLAKLGGSSGLKTALGQSQTTNDAQLAFLLEAASTLAEQLAGLTPGALRRQVGIVEYPTVTHPMATRLRLACRPIESIASIRQLYAPGSDADFTATDPLTEFSDYVIAAPDLGAIERVNGVWYADRARLVKVVYTAGYVDPSRIEVALATATWTASSKTLTQTGAFANYTYAAGDAIVITGGTGVTPGTYPIASRVSADAITLVDSIAPGSGNLATGDITSSFAGTLPPADLQQAVIQQAVLAWNTRDNAGIQQISFGDAGGSFTTKPMQPHPALVAAVQRYRSFL